MKEGKKDDDGKLRFDLLPPEIEEELAKVLTYGAQKYEARNYEKGIKYSRIYAAMRRHINTWQQGEDIDPESGLMHLSHALWELMALVLYERRSMGKEWDDLRNETNRQ